MSLTSSKQPNQLLTSILWLFFKPYLKYKYNFSYDNSVIKSLKGPAIILGNHASVLDVFLMGVSAYPLSLNYVAGYGWFNYFGLGLILRQLKAIPKFQYQIDIISIKEMINVIKDNQVLGLFPTGRLASAGVGLPVDENVAKLLKRLDAPVYFFRIDGAYLTIPKWAKHHRKGRIEGKYHLLFDQVNLRKNSINEISKTINLYLSYDDYSWNNSKRIKYKGKKLAENLEQILFICPACELEGNLKSHDQVLECKCGLSLTINEFGEFENNKYFLNPRDWNNYQKTELIRKYKSKTLSLLSEVEVFFSKPGKKGTKYYGSGYITLVDDRLVFKDKDLGKNNSLNILLSTFPSLPFKAGSNFEVSDKEVVYKFILKAGYQAAKWSLAVEAMAEVLKDEK